jgi:hypothetical protein
MISLSRLVSPSIAVTVLSELRGTCSGCDFIDDSSFVNIMEMNKI